MLLRVNLLLLMTSALAGAARHDVICNEGSGSFQKTSRSGITAFVGAERGEGFAKRSCRATLSWDKESIEVSHGSREDLDVFGANFGTGGPVAAFSSSDADGACCMTYRIYTLDTPPHLLRTISGGSYYAAADTDLDGEVEIWTDDAAAINGMDGLSSSEIEFLPTFVLRLTREGLLDASAGFRQHYDEIIRDIRSGITVEAAREFRGSDGKLPLSRNPSSEELSRAHRLRPIKIQVLEIVWAYLYSGRAKQAWQALQEFWPASDAERIRTEIMKARTQGVAAQLNGVASISRRNKIRVFDQLEAIPAQPISMRLYPSEKLDGLTEKTEVELELVIDSAGKVQSITAAGKADPVRKFVQASAAQWKFIPAFRGGIPVASRTRTVVSLQR